MSVKIRKRWNCSKQAESFNNISVTQPNKRELLLIGK